MVGAVERTLEVHGDDRVEVFFGHLDERPVADDARVVDQDVDLAERVDGRLHDALSAVELRDRVVARDGLASERLDLLAHLRRGVLFRAPAVDAAADVVDDDARAFAGHAQHELAADPASGPGDDGDPTVQQPHVSSRPRPSPIR